MIKKFDLYKESLLNNLRGPSEDEILNENPDLFLKISIENNNVEGVKKALDYGADQALFNAVLYNKYDVILFLLGKGANLYAQNQFMIETLIARQKIPQLKYLIEHKYIEYNKLNDDNKKYAEIYLPSDLFNKLKNGL